MYRHAKTQLKKKKKTEKERQRQRQRERESVEEVKVGDAAEFLVVMVVRCESHHAMESLLASPLLTHLSLPCCGKEMLVAR